MTLVHSFLTKVLDFPDQKETITKEFVEAVMEIDKELMHSLITNLYDLRNLAG